MDANDEPKESVRSTASSDVAATWKSIDLKIARAVAAAAEQSGRPEAAAQATDAEGTPQGLGAGPGNTPPTSSQISISLQGNADYKATFGLDWLEYGMIVRWSDDAFLEVMNQLDNAKSHAQETEQDSVHIHLKNVEHVNVQRLGVKRGGSRGTYYDYKLLYQDIEFFVARFRGDSEGPANVFVTIRGRQCLLHGALEAYEKISDLLFRLGAESIRNERVSRVDLRLDIAGLRTRFFESFIADRCFISRVRDVQAWHNLATDSWTGFSAGKSPLRLNVYDKMEDQRRKYDAEIFQALIDRCWGGTEPEHATRLEYQISRAWLMKFGIKSVADLLANLGSIVHKLTHEFIRLTVEPVISEEKHQSRAETHPLWEAIQAAFLEGAKAPVGKLARIRHECVNPKKLAAQAAGCLLSAALQRKLAFVTFEDFLEAARAMIRDLFPNKAAENKFLKRYWQKWKDKPDDHERAA